MTQAVVATLPELSLLAGVLAVRVVKWPAAAAVAPRTVPSMLPPVIATEAGLKDVAVSRFLTHKVVDTLVLLSLAAGVLALRVVKCPGFGVFTPILVLSMLPPDIAMLSLF